MFEKPGTKCVKYMKLTGEIYIYFEIHLKIIWKDGQRDGRYVIKQVQLNVLIADSMMGIQVFTAKSFRLLKPL